MKKQPHPSTQPRNMNTHRPTWIDDGKLSSVVGGTGQLIKPIGPGPGPGG
jgi:hypothetical protein